jgi:hypothetical protein
VNNQNYCQYSGKVKFASEKSARIAIERQPRSRLFRSDSYKVGLDVYKCPDCGNFHVGTEIINIKRRKKDKNLDFLLDLELFIRKLSKRNRILRKDRD